MKSVDVKIGCKLEDYESYVSLHSLLKDFRSEARILAPKLRDRSVWMVNSTARGGGVAEMLPTMISLLRQLDVKAEWAVIETDQPEFFALTKRIHNLIHGQGEPQLSEADRDLYEKVCKQNAQAFSKMIKPGDIVLLHDPQPMGMAPFLKSHVDVKLVWRCHIGLDDVSDQTETAWQFLCPYFDSYDLSVFSAPEYIPHYCSDRVTVINPGIDPLSHKNRDLPIHKLVGILNNAGILPAYHPMLTPPFEDLAKQLMPDGSFSVPARNDNIGLLSRPIVCQISRWDRLKGFLPLMQGFCHLKERISKFGSSSERHQRRLELVRLVLAGPDPAFVEDDPEGEKVLTELTDFYRSLPESIQEDIALLLLPMSSRKENELMVNALQRCSSIVVQNSLQEGFGLTATEAMWKLIPVLGSRACGLRQQIRNGVDGKLIDDPEDPVQIAEGLNDMLENDKGRQVWSYNAKKRVLDRFLVFTQLSRWLDVFANLRI